MYITNENKELKLMFFHIFTVGFILVLSGITNKVLSWVKSKYKSSP